MRRHCCIISVGLLLLILNGCQNQKNQQNQKAPTQEVQPSQSAQLDLSKIIVAMTYDEVEKLIGKPSMINRGANEFENQELPESHDREELQSRVDIAQHVLDYLQGPGPHDSTFWLQQQKISNVGSLIYVRWDYLAQTKQDTFWTFQVSYSESTTISYSAEYYGLFDDIESVDPQDKVTDKYQFSDKKMYNYAEEGKYYSVTPKEHSKEISLIEQTAPPHPGRKLLKKTTITTSSKHYVKNPIYTREYYVVQYVQSVFFDASSGRVRNVGWNPVSITRIFPL